jgi:hypothetical protein
MYITVLTVGILFKFISFSCTSCWFIMNAFLHITEADAHVDYFLSGCPSLNYFLPEIPNSTCLSEMVV